MPQLFVPVHLPGATAIELGESGALSIASCSVESMTSAQSSVRESGWVPRTESTSRSAAEIGSATPGLPSTCAAGRGNIRDENGAVGKSGSTLRSLIGIADCALPGARELRYGRCPSRGGTR
eukprot:4578881-Prymnesium_polylepis.2